MGILKEEIRFLDFEAASVGWKEVLVGMLFFRIFSICSTSSRSTSCVSVRGSRCGSVSGCVGSGCVEACVEAGVQENVVIITPIWTRIRISRDEIGFVWTIPR